MNFNQTSHVHQDPSYAFHHDGQITTFSASFSFNNAGCGIKILKNNYPEYPDGKHTLAM